VPCDLIWLDEDMGYDDRILNECLGRIIATNGRIIVSLTPVLGLTPIRKRFIEGGPGIFQVRGGIEQALHIPKERHAEIIAATPKREVTARIYAQEMQGEGAVFSTPLSQISHRRSHASMPLDYGCVWGCDFNRGGSHPFVAVFAMHDRINDAIYVMDIIKMGNESPDLHAARIKSHPCWDAPFLYPHDGGQVGDFNSGDTIAHLYRRTGLNLPHGHVTFPEGGYSLSAGIVEMEQRFCTGRLLIAEWCLPDFRMEYANYHYKDGKIVRQDDDVLDAIRVICMGIRFARSQDQLDQRRIAHMQGTNTTQIAEGLNFCPWCGREPCECTGSRYNSYLSI
jgi:hypothetical protein